MMDQKNKDTLANLISGEMARMKEILARVSAAGHKGQAEYWQTEINDLERLDAAIWGSLR